jgi:Na+/melibiose symporter-like transporter
MERSIPMQRNTGAAVRKATSPLRYAIGMFGTSIPINMFKTYASFFYLDKLALITSKQFSLVLLIYTFIDAIDNPVYGFLSDRPPAMADDWRAASGVVLYPVF